MYVCMCYLCLCVCMYMCVCVYMCMCVCIYVCMYACMYVCVSVCICNATYCHVCVCVHALAIYDATYRRGVASSSPTTSSAKETRSRRC